MEWKMLSINWTENDKYLFLLAEPTSIENPYAAWTFCSAQLTQSLLVFYFGDENIPSAIAFQGVMESPSAKEWGE